MSKMKYAVSGFIVGGLFFGSIGFAATSKIEVSFDPIKFIIDKVDKTPASNKFNNNGTTVPASIMYNGTTYLPLRLVGNMLGKPVAWDAKTKSVLFGESVVVGEYLTNIPPAKIADNSEVNSLQTVDGQTYEKTLYIPSYFYTTFTSDTTKTTQSYNLNAQYKILSFNYGIRDKSQSGASAKISVFADGQEVWSSSAVKGVPSQSASISMNGVLKLDIYVEGTSGNAGVVIFNPLLTK
ncbi:stalk domain-containing protein [Paenibacillus sp. RS8]|uniref:stalk domain-containing protein n=1 Tax=Paenibacillus sp. RS8 TaxID=3242681 RepID=UPI0035C1FDE9